MATRSRNKEYKDANKLSPTVETTKKVSLPTSTAQATSSTSKDEKNITKDRMKRIYKAIYNQCAMHIEDNTFFLSFPTFIIKKKVGDELSV